MDRKMPTLLACSYCDVSCRSQKKAIVLSLSVLLNNTETERNLTKLSFLWSLHRPTKQSNAHKHVGIVAVFSWTCARLKIWCFCLPFTHLTGHTAVWKMLAESWAPAVSQTFEPHILQQFLFLRPALVRTILVGFFTGSAVFELLICSAHVSKSLISMTEVKLPPSIIYPTDPK